MVAVILTGPVAEIAPDVVIAPAEAVISTIPLEVIAAALAIAPELVNRTVPALMAPLPVVIVLPVDSTERLPPALRAPLPE